MFDIEAEKDGLVKKTSRGSLKMAKTRASELFEQGYEVKIRTPRGHVIVGRKNKKDQARNRILWEYPSQVAKGR